MTLLANSTAWLAGYIPDLPTPFDEAGAIDLAAPQEPLELDLARTGHHHDAVAQGFTAGFIKKWNVSKEKIGGVSAALGFEAPLTTDARMQDLLQRAFLFRVGEDYRANLRPVQVAVLRIDRGPEFPCDQGPHLRIVPRQVARGLVRIKERGRGNDFAQTFAEGRLSRGNPTRDSYCRHDLDMNTSHFIAATAFKPTTAITHATGSRQP